MACVVSPQEEFAVVGGVAAGGQQEPALSFLCDSGPVAQREWGGTGWDSWKVFSEGTYFFLEVYLLLRSTKCGVDAVENNEH